MVCALILWRSDLGLLMDKFCLFFDSYLPNTICFGITNGQILSIYQTPSVLGLLMDKFCLFLTVIY